MKLLFSADTHLVCMKSFPHMLYNQQKHGFSLEKCNYCMDGDTV